ncbi:MAG: type II toxin-antitoxin system VapC family toxin [bacterium]|nr:type II toxin-antitoxin system VapC family toxin [bacterium]
MTKYYVDSCIWLNFLNKEQNKVQGLPVWKLTEEFLRQCDDKIITSKFVVKEIADKVKDQRMMLRLERYISTKWTKEEIFPLAKEMESKEKYMLSFYDCIHLCIAIKENYVLITRDERLLTIAKKYIEAIKPEEIIY